MAYKIKIYGIVQGVGFRPTVFRVAKQLGARGYVKNKGSYVEVLIDKDVDLFIEILRKNLPSIARIDRIEVEEVDVKFTENDKFTICESEDDKRFSLIPSDTAICNDCLKELFDESNRRYLYPFISCTVCEARFSIIFAIPYDRRNTTMNEFEMCEECRKEYSDPDNRRFHAQTISCPSCGPRLFLYRNIDRKVIDSPNSIMEFAKLVDEGNICLIKSWGGMHAISILDVENEMRKRFARPQKPFAVMVRDISVAEKYAYVDESERELLTSPQRPIVLLRKKIESDLVSPGLPTIGLYLPYSAIHYILFKYLKTDAIIMTSANPPDTPTLIDNDEAFKLPVDYLLLHNRKIANRVDDSVVKVWRGRPLYIRKSRGYVPDQVSINFDKTIISLGSEENSSVSFTYNKMLYLSPVVTSISTLEGVLGLERLVENFIKMLNINSIDVVVIDKHPAYSYRKYALELAERYSAVILEIQHHHAHALSLQFEYDKNDIVALTFDGTGYGGKFGERIEMWGGEIILSQDKDFRRIASLEPIPMIGGEKAIIEPARLLFALKEKYNIELKVYDEKTEEILRGAMKRERVHTTSFGRFLDCLAVYLNVGRLRSYEGELAMKLEKLLLNGKKTHDFEVDISSYEGRKIVSVGSIFQQLEGINGKAEDIAFSAVYAVLKGFIELLRDYGFEEVGFTGGVAYSWPINSMLEEIAAEHDIKIIRHQRFAPGDNGLSVGQAYGGYKNIWH